MRSGERGARAAWFLTRREGVRGGEGRGETASLRTHANLHTPLEKQPPVLLLFFYVGVLYRPPSLPWVSAAEGGGKGGGGMDGWMSRM